MENHRQKGGLTQETIPPKLGIFGPLLR